MRGFKKWSGHSWLERRGFAGHQPAPAATQAWQAGAVVEGPAPTIVAATGRAGQGRDHTRSTAHQAAKRSEATRALAERTVDVRPGHRVGAPAQADLAVRGHVRS